MKNYSRLQLGRKADDDEQVFPSFHQRVLERRKTQLRRSLCKLLLTPHERDQPSACCDSADNRRHATHLQHPKRYRCAVVAYECDGLGYVRSARSALHISSGLHTKGIRLCAAREAHNKY